MAQRFVRGKLAEIDTRPAGDQRQSAFVGDVLAVLVELLLRLGIGFAEDHRLQIEGKDFARVATGALCRLPDIDDIAFQYGL
ncbi:hypothetical protein D9M72_527170 [compost metagenome]